MEQVSSRQSIQSLQASTPGENQETPSSTCCGHIFTVIYNVVFGTVKSLSEIFFFCIFCCPKAVDNENQEDPTSSDNLQELRNRLSKMDMELGQLHTKSYNLELDNKQLKNQLSESQKKFSSLKENVETGSSGDQTHSDCAKIERLKNENQQLQAKIKETVSSEELKELNNKVITLECQLQKAVEENLQLLSKTSTEKESNEQKLEDNASNKEDLMKIFKLEGNIILHQQLIRTLKRQIEEKDRTIETQSQDIQLQEERIKELEERLVSRKK
jgi:peptidoglycan hydrolase CwlO-like protein